MMRHAKKRCAPSTSFCCDTAWDSICVARRLSCARYAGGPPPGLCPESDHDCFSEGAAGCTDLECCEAVYAVDAFCCNTSWDGICVEEAHDLCGALQCSADCPADLNLDGEVNGADLGILCANWATDDPCSDLNDDGIVDGADLGLLLAAWGPCFPSICPASDHDCLTEGGPGCSDLECCEAVCSVDAFCCETSWDGVCVGEATEICGGEPGLCPESDHDCLTEGGPGCSDLECREAVCGVDAFCCETSWDGVCVGEATEICGGEPGLCPESDHDCLTEGGPGCSDLECCEAVCSVDSFCCAVSWDGVCVGEATEICGGEPGLCPESDHDCLTEGGPGCSDLECCEAVCSVDPSAARSRGTACVSARPPRSAAASPASAPSPTTTA